MYHRWYHTHAKRTTIGFFKRLSVANGPAVLNRVYGNIFAFWDALAGDVAWGPSLCGD